MSFWQQFVDTIEMAWLGYTVRVSPFVERGKPIWVKAQRTLIAHRADAIRLKYAGGHHGSLDAAQEYTRHCIDEQADAAVQKLERMQRAYALRDEWRHSLQFCPAVDGEPRRFHEFAHWWASDTYECVHCGLQVSRQTFRKAGAVLS